MPQIRLERVSKYYPQDKKQMAAVQGNQSDGRAG